MVIVLLYILIMVNATLYTLVLIIIFSYSCVGAGTVVWKMQIGELHETVVTYVFILVHVFLIILSKITWKFLNGVLLEIGHYL